MFHTEVVEGRTPRVHFASPGPERWKERSRTLDGLADAMAGQWGAVLQGQDTMSQHAACSPSSATMWLNCPASVTLTKDMTRPSSKYAREGTAAHKVAEMILNGDVFLPDKVKVENEEFIVSVGMCRALNPYVTFAQILQALPDTRMVFEQRVYVPDTEGRVWGTADCGAWLDPRDYGYGVGPSILFVTDLKFGKGHVVSPDAPQLKLYALGLAAHFKANEAGTAVLLTICQPRVGNVPLRFHQTTLGELWQWSDFEVRPAVERIIAGDTTEKAGSHCRWCVRRTECRAFAELHQSRAAEAFDDDDDI